MPNYGPGAAPVFTDAEVLKITGAFSAHAAANTPAFQTLLDRADAASVALKKLKSTDPISAIADLAKPFKPLLKEMGLNITWSQPKQVTFVMQAVRLRRYARYDAASFRAFLDEIELRTNQADADSANNFYVHW